MKHSEIKNTIVETASMLFYKNGYNSTGINQIISESGIAKATLYSHFKSKEDICIAYLKHKNTCFIGDLEKYARAKKKGTSQVLALFDFLHDFFKNPDFNGCWAIKTVAEIPQDNENIRQEIQKQKSDLIELISKLISENLTSIKQQEIPLTAKRVYLLYESAVSESHLHQKDWPIVEAKEICSQIIS